LYFYIFVEACTELGLKVNVPKTKVMQIKRIFKNRNIVENEFVDDENILLLEEPATFEVYGQEIEVVEEFCYLGSIMTSDGRCAIDISSRIEKSNKAYGALKKYIFSNKHVPFTAKMKAITGVVEPTLLYGSENWALTVEDERRLNAAGMRWLRSALGITLLDRNKNEHIRARCNTESIATKIGRRQLRYFGHVARRADTECLTKPIKEWQAPTGWTRPRGRPPISWSDTVHRQLDKVKIGSLGEANDIARDRAKWREKINSLRDVQVCTIPAISAQSSVDTRQLDPNIASA
jgi:hypothetical protein